MEEEAAMEGVQGAPRGGEGGRHGIESRSGSQSRAAGGEVRGGIERAAALDQEETCDEFSSNFFGRASIRYGVASEMLMWFARRKNRKQVGVGVAVECVIKLYQKGYYGRLFYRDAILLRCIVFTVSKPSLRTITLPP